MQILMTDNTEAVQMRRPLYVSIEKGKRRKSDNGTRYDEGKSFQADY